MASSGSFGIKFPHLTEDEINKLFDMTEEVQHVDVPDKLYEFLAKTFYSNLVTGSTSEGASTVLQASGEQTKKITQLVRYYAAIWGPDEPKSFVMYSTDVAERSSQIIKGANIVSKVGRYGVPVIGGVIDFGVQVADGEDVGDAAIKATAHVGIGIGGGVAGAAIGATVGSIFPIVGTAGGAVVGFVAGVVIAAAGNAIFDLVYDNREAIYEVIIDTVDSIGETLSDFGDSILNTAEEGMKSVGNAVEGFLNGLGTVFG